MYALLRLRRRSPSPGGTSADETQISKANAGRAPTPEPKPARGPTTTLMDLPPEIHILISKHLIYPDALSLKHTNRYFYGLVYTGVRLKVEWLVERRSLHLECPNDHRCDLGSDLRFCRGSVPLLMQRRREHMECESRPGLGCLVYGTTQCSHRRKLSARCQRWLRKSLTVELWWVLLALVPLVFAWLWVTELVGWDAARPSALLAYCLGSQPNDP